MDTTLDDQLEKALKYQHAVPKLEQGFSIISKSLKYESKYQF